ncbi:hypothetical protein D3C80_1660620 [compost metagenome]
MSDEFDFVMSCLIALAGLIICVAICLRNRSHEDFDDASMLPFADDRPALRRMQRAGVERRVPSSLEV